MENEFIHAVNEAFTYDSKILLEEYIGGREIECAVLGNEDPFASPPGEIITDPNKHQFYSYEAKYIDEKGATLKIPANLPQDVVERIKELAVKTFKALCCEGMARVDFFYKDDGQVLVNEINTIPGFTNISMYPKMWEASGISNTELIDRLIKLALDRFAEGQKLKTSFDS
jgi:D-alanine-D-alanine ligase